MKLRLLIINILALIHTLMYHCVGLVFHLHVLENELFMDINNNNNIMVIALFL